jgi:hypothetical protein
MVETHKEQPFFLYLALTAPHANNEATRALKNGQEVPDLGVYADKDWTEPNKGQAAMITRHGCGHRTAACLIKNLGLDEQTLIFSAATTGLTRRAETTEVFQCERRAARDQARPLRRRNTRAIHRALAGKDRARRDLTARGLLRLIFSATLSEARRAQKPARISTASALLPPCWGSRTRRLKHEFLYWEFHEGGTKQAALFGGHWKGVRLRPGRSVGALRSRD